MINAIKAHTAHVNKNKNSFLEHCVNWIRRSQYDTDNNRE